MHTAILTYKIKTNGLAHPYLSNILSNVSDANSYVTRISINADLSVLNVIIVANKRTFQFRATIIWNEIPHSLRNVPSLHIFKSGYTAQFE